MTKTVVAIYNSRDEAENAANQLVNSGFNRSDIDVASGRTDTSREGESGISRFFKNLFGNDDKTERYTKVAERGWVVSVYTHSDEEARRASALLDEYGAIDVDENYHRHFGDKKSEDRKDYIRNETYAAANTGYEKARSDVNYDTPDERRDNLVNKEEKYDIKEENYNDIDRNKTIPVIEEDIKVGKKEVATGAVRIRSRIIEKPVEENIRLREEHIHVERNKVNRPATEEELNNFKSETVEIIEHGEVPDVQKTSNVVEEVSLGKEVKHRDEVVRDKIRKTEVDVENIHPDDRSNKPGNL
jgi:stress response protein YsnF